MFSSLRARLFIINLGLLIIGFGSLTYWAGRQMAQTSLNDYGNNQALTALLLANQLSEPLEDGDGNIRPIIDRVATDLDATVALFDRSDRLIYSSGGDAVSLIEPASYTVANGLVQSSANIQHDDEKIGSVQIATDSSIPEFAIRQRWIELGLAFLGFTIAGTLITLWLLNTLTRPLDQLRESALQIADGDLTHRASGLPDNEIGAVGTAFNKMADRTSALIDEQRAFASNASHELRTPLTTIRLRTEALKEGIAPPLHDQYIQEIDAESRRLSRLVDDLLLLSRLDAQRLEAGNEQIDLVRVLYWIKRESEPDTIKKSIKLTVSAPEPPIMVTATLSHIQIVVRNIVDNAIKYTPDGGAVAIGLAMTDRHALITVLDDGRGISAENLPSIGKRFYRTDQSRGRETAGTGLGLALVRLILDLYDGTFSIMSDGVDQGTRVTAGWPIQPPSIDSK